MKYPVLLKFSCNSYFFPACFLVLPYVSCRHLRYITFDFFCIMPQSAASLFLHIFIIIQRSFQCSPHVLTFSYIFQCHMNFLTICSEIFRPTAYFSIHVILLKKDFMNGIIYVQNLYFISYSRHHTRICIFRNEIAACLPVYQKTSIPL